MTKKDNSNLPIRWYVVSDDEGGYVVSARTHSRARYMWGNYISGNLDFEECFSLQCQLAKELNKIPEHTPKKEGEYFDDMVFLLKIGEFSIAHECYCPVCHQAKEICRYEDGEEITVCCSSCYDK